MTWIYLIIAGFCEVAWAVGLKHSNGFTKPLISIVTAVLMIASFFFLALALRKIPLGTGYAIWTGIGVVGTTIIGLIFLNESRDFWRLASLAMILIGIVGLKISHTELP